MTINFINLERYDKKIDWVYYDQYKHKMWMFIAKCIIALGGVLTSLYVIKKIMEPSPKPLEINNNTDVRSLLTEIGMSDNEIDELINDEEKLALMLQFIYEYTSMRAKNLKIE